MPHDPATGDFTAELPSERSRAAAIALAAVIGPLGTHRFYVGKAGTGVLMLCTLGGLGVWWLYDVILLAAGAFRDAQGRRVVNWLEAGTAAAGLGRGLTPQQQDMVFEELDTLRSDYHELVERVDFLERMLAQLKDRALPPGA